MSEIIDYDINAEGFKNDKEAKEFLELCAEFQEHGEGEFNQENITVWFSVTNGWRGGGNSCEDLLRGHFEKWLIAHKNVKVNFNCRYVEHAPIQTIMVKGKEWDDAGVEYE